MIVLEATGIRDVASGPLLRLIHDRFVPGPAARCATRCGALSRLAGRPADHRLPEDRAPQADARVHGGRWSRAGALPESRARAERRGVRARPRALPARPAPAPRLPATATGRRSRTSSRDEIRAHPRLVRGRGARGRAPAGFDGVELHFAHAYTMASFLSVTNGAHRRVRRQLREPAAPAPRGRRGGARGGRARASSWAAATSGSEDILGEDGRIDGNTLDGRAARSAWRWRGPGLDFLSVSRGGKFEDAQQPPVGEAAYPVHRPQRPRPASRATSATRSA